MKRILPSIAIVLVISAIFMGVVSSETYNNDNVTNENDTIIEPISTNHTEEDNIIISENVTNNTTPKNNTTTITPSKPSHETTTEEPIIPAVQENGGVVITAIYPTGCERLTIKNNNNFTAHLEGWQLFNGCGKLTTFPDIDLKAGNTLTVYAKTGTNTEDSFYLSRTKQIFKDTGGTAYLFCACGNTTSTFKN